MTVNGRPLKRARRRVTADLPDLLSFPAPACEGPEGPFRANMREFLGRFARMVPPEPAAVLATGGVGPPAPAWQVGFRVGDADVAVLEVVEEDVPRSRRVYCEHCTVVGWSRHPVCGRRYHFIIRNDYDLPHRKTCWYCGLMVELFESRCPSCKHGLIHDDQEDWEYAQLDNPRHLLHGIVHSNGFGHLVRINGRKGGSKLLTGCQLMDFWDRLCKFLKVRKVSVMDVSKKHGVDYRILHAVTSGRSWYSERGFTLGAGSFGITSEAYWKAIDNLSSVPLSLFFPHSRAPRTKLQNTIAFYHSLSNRPLVTLRDLFRYVTELLDSKNVRKKGLTYDIQVQPRIWPDEEIGRATDIILKVLHAADRTRWVAMRTLKGAVSQALGSPELLAHCLEGIGGTRTDDGMVVAVRCNGETNAVEYRLTDELFSMQNVYKLTRDHLLGDLKFLYDALLNPHMMHHYKPQATHEQAKSSAVILLDCKQFIKHYDLERDFLPPNPFAVHIWCHVELSDQAGDQPSTPPELLVLPLTATVADLKAEAAKAYHDIYLIFQAFQAEQLLDCATASEATQVKLLFGANGTAHIRGRCLGGERRIGIYRMERGIENWTVNCTCGAKDDDGERMLACDTCSVWHHTRCASISDFDQVPKKFVCRSCTLLHKPKSSGLRLVYNSASDKRCKAEMPAITQGGGCREACMYR